MGLRHCGLQKGPAMSEETDQELNIAFAVLVERLVVQDGFIVTPMKTVIPDYVAHFGREAVEAKIRESQGHA